MITVVAIKPVGDKQLKRSYIETVSIGFEVEYLELEHLFDLPADKPIIIFHPRQKNDNPSWLPPERVEDFIDFDFPDNAYYVFNSDYGNIIDEIEKKCRHLIENSRWVKIPTKSEDFQSIHGHQAAAIVLWELYKKHGKATLKDNTW